MTTMRTHRTTDPLPETGEGVHGENLASGLKYRPQDLPITDGGEYQEGIATATTAEPGDMREYMHASMEGREYDQERISEFVESSLPETVSHAEIQQRAGKLAEVPGGTLRRTE